MGKRQTERKERKLSPNKKTHEGLREREKERKRWMRDLGDTRNNREKGRQGSEHLGLWGQVWGQNQLHKIQTN